MAVIRQQDFDRNSKSKIHCNNYSYTSPLDYIKSSREKSL